MSAIRDALDNIKHGLLAMWVAFPPVAQALILGLVVGAVLGSGFTVWAML